MERIMQQVPADQVSHEAVNAYMLEVGATWDDETETWSLTQKSAVEVFREVEKKRTRRDKATAMHLLHEQGYSLREIAAIFGLKHPGSVKHAIDKHSQLSSDQERISSLEADVDRLNELLP